MLWRPTWGADAAHWVGNWLPICVAFSTEHCSPCLSHEQTTRISNQHRVEFLEASGCCILACTVAWDASHGGNLGSGSGSSSSNSSSSSSSSSPAVGFASLDAAVMDAVAALDAVQAPAPPAAGAFKLRRLGSSHTPDEAGWHALMDGTHAELSAAAAAAAAQQQAAAAAAPQPSEDQALDACTPLLRVSPEAAREEYLLNGQEGLDDLLAALEGGFEAAATPPDAGGLTKVVLARRTDVAIEGRVEPLALLEALQERDPRAYQIMLQVGGWAVGWLPCGLLGPGCCKHHSGMGSRLAMPHGGWVACVRTCLQVHGCMLPHIMRPLSIVFHRCPPAPPFWAPRPSACTHAPAQPLRQRRWRARAPAAQVRRWAQEASDRGKNATMQQW